MADEPSKTKIPQTLPMPPYLYQADDLVTYGSNLTAAAPQFPTGKVWYGTTADIQPKPGTGPLGWQDIRLCAGEGKLSPESILAAANILWGRRLDSALAEVARLRRIYVDLGNDA